MPLALTDLTSDCQQKGLGQDFKKTLYKVFVGDFPVPGLDPKKMIIFERWLVRRSEVVAVGKAHAGPGRAGEIYPAQNVIRYPRTQATGTHFRLLSLVR